MTFIFANVSDEQDNQPSITCNIFTLMFPLNI